MDTTEQQLRQRENNEMNALHAEVQRCFRVDDVEGLRALVARRGYALGTAPGIIMADGRLVRGLEGAIRFGAFECFREILYNVDGVRVSDAFQRLSAEVSPYSAPLMSDEVLARIHDTMVILIARLPDDWNFQRERTHARRLRSWAVWIGLAALAPLASGARAAEPAGGFAYGEGEGERRDQWLCEYLGERPAVEEPPAYRDFWTRYFVECASCSTLEDALVVYNTTGMYATPEQRAIVDAEVSLREQREQAFAMSTQPQLAAAEQRQPARLLRHMPTDVIEMIARAKMGPYSLLDLTIF